MKFSLLRRDKVFVLIGVIVLSLSWYYVKNRNETLRLTANDGPAIVELVEEKAETADTSTSTEPGALGTTPAPADELSEAPEPGSDRTIFTATTIARYDGTDASLPIYVAYRGKVYDVTPGKQFYEPGAVYHFLVGKDSTSILEQIGGDIIERKYEVVGTYTP